jgi:hypothetical protein
MRKSMAIYFVIVFTAMLFIAPNYTDNNLVNAVTEQFDIKDTFETQINNRIYTEYDNYTIGEFFRDEKDNPCEFSTDEDFTYEHGSYEDGSHSVADGVLTVEFNNKIGVENGYYILTTPAIFSLLDYSVFELRAKVNDTSLDCEIYFKDEDRVTLVSIANPNNRPQITSDEYDIYTHAFDYLYDQEYDITEIQLAFRIYDVESSFHNGIKFELDFFNIWRNNNTDYAVTELSDTWDFQEDTDGWDFSSATESIASGNLVVSPAGTKTYTDEYIYTDFDTYQGFMLKFLVDFNSWAGDHNYLFIRMIDNDGNYIQQIERDLVEDNFYMMYISENYYDAKVGDFDITDGYRIWMRFNVDDGGNLQSDDYLKIDYSSFYHDNLKDDNTRKIQDTTSYRAYRGMRSYISDINNYTYYEGFTANLNSSIKIDIPDISFFPEKIQFYIYSSKYYNVTLHIGDYTDILYENTLYLDEWMFMSKSINRADYIFNNTEHEIYFEIIYDSLETENLFYIDELNIKYTEPPQSFSYDFNTRTGVYLDGYDYSATNNFFYFEPSGEYEYSMNGDSDGIEYNSYSDSLFTRRMFIDYTLDCDELNVDILIYQTIYISLDKEYRLVSALESRAESSINPNSREVYMIHFLYEGESLINSYSSGLIQDYTIDGFNNIEFNIRFQQEDYDTISISSVYNNKLTGNSSSGIFSFEVNKNSDIKNSILKTNITSQVIIRPITSAPFVWIDSNPTATLKITREIKHSAVVDSNPDVNIPVAPEWRGGIYAFADIWYYMVYYVQLFIYNVIEFFRQSMYLRDIVKGIGDFFSTFKDYWTNLVGYLGDFLSALGDIENIGDFIGLLVETVITHLGNVFDTIVLMVADIIGSIGDIIDGEMLGFPVLDDILDAWEAFVLRDWEDFGTAFKNIVPEINEETIGFLLFIPDWFLSLWLDDVNFLSTLVINGIKISKEIFMWMTILIIMYMVYFMQLIIKRDFDRVRIEVSTWVSAVNWIIDGIIFVFHWLFELLHAVLDVTIPFT